MATRVTHTTKQYVFDGRKSVPLSQLPEEAWKVIAGEDVDEGSIKTLYETVAVLRRGVNIRANSLVQIPWYVRDAGDEPIFSHSEHEELPDEFVWLENLPMLLWLAEASLSLVGKGFWYAQTPPRRATQIQEMRWLMPSTVTPLWDGERGLTAYERRIGGQKKILLPEQVIYFALPNPLHETKEATAPAQAAASAAGVILHLDVFAQNFFERGAIRATLLSVPNTTMEDERKKLKAWWNQVVSGVQNAFAAHVVSSEVTATTIGEGTSELADVGLTESKQRQVALALGIPYSKLFADAANYATSVQDNQGYYQDTVIPDAKLIARAINRHPIFKDRGLRLTFEPDEMSIFQEDELERSNVYLNYVNGKLKPSVAAQIAGLSLPENMNYEDLDPEELTPEQLAQMQQNRPPQPGQPFGGEPEDDEERQEEMRRFRAWAKKRVGRGDFDADQFKSDRLTRADKASVLLDLAEGGIAVDAPFRLAEYP